MFGGNKTDESYFKALDSSIKKNAAFVKKVKTNLSDETKQSLLKEVKKKNFNGKTIYQNIFFC